MTPDDRDTERFFVNDPGEHSREITPDDRRFMELALDEARRAAAEGEVPVGAVAVQNGIVVAAAHNLVEARKSVSAHAEFEVLRALEARTGDWRMSDFTFYVTKEPCPMCAGMLVNARVARIVFGAPDPAGGGCGGALDIPGAPGMLWHPEVVGGVMAAESVELLREFFRAARSRRTSPAISKEK